MAPEQLRGENDSVGPQTDVYSLGIILFELLTGERPFHGTLPQIYAQVLSTASIIPSSIRETIDPALDAICQKATHADVSQRFKSAAELATELGNYLATPTLAPKSVQSTTPKEVAFEFKPRTRAAMPPRRRNPKLLIAGGGAAFFLALCGVIVILIQNKDGTTTELRIPDSAVAVEVQKDGKSVAKINFPEVTYLQNMHKLKGIEIADTKVTEAGLDALLATIPSLNCLVIDRLPISDNVMLRLENYPLEIFWAAGTNIGDQGIAHLRSKTLHSCSLDSTRITDEGLKHFEGRSFSKLGLRNTAITDAGIEHLKKCKRIESIQLTSTKITDAGIASLKQAFPECKIEK